MRWNRHDRASSSYAVLGIWLSGSCCCPVRNGATSRLPLFKERGCCRRASVRRTYTSMSKPSSDCRLLPCRRESDADLCLSSISRGFVVVVVVGWAWGSRNGSASAACRLDSPLRCATGRSPSTPYSPSVRRLSPPAQVLDVELGVCEPEGPSSQAAVVLPLDDESPAVAWLLGSLTRCLQSQRP